MLHVEGKYPLIFSAAIQVQCINKNKTLKALECSRYFVCVCICEILGAAKSFMLQTIELAGRIIYQAIECIM